MDIQKQYQWNFSHQQIFFLKDLEFLLLKDRDRFLAIHLQDEYCSVEFSVEGWEHNLEHVVVSRNFKVIVGEFLLDRLEIADLEKNVKLNIPLKTPLFGFRIFDNNQLVIINGEGAEGYLLRNNNFNRYWRMTGTVLSCVFYHEEFVTASKKKNTSVAVCRRHSSESKFFKNTFLKNAGNNVAVKYGTINRDIYIFVMTKSRISIYDDERSPACRYSIDFEVPTEYSLRILNSFLAIELLATSKVVVYVCCSRDHLVTEIATLDISTSSKGPSEIECNGDSTFTFWNQLQEDCYIIDSHSLFKISIHSQVIMSSQIGPKEKLHALLVHGHKLPAIQYLSSLLASSSPLEIHSVLEELVTFLREDERITLSEVTKLLLCPFLHCPNSVAHQHFLAFFYFLVSSNVWIVPEFSVFLCKFLFSTNKVNLMSQLLEQLVFEDSPELVVYLQSITAPTSRLRLIVLDMFHRFKTSQEAFTIERC